MLGEAIKKEFPFFDPQTNKALHDFVYLDSAASSLSPTVMLEALKEVYTHAPANVHRSPHAVGHKATDYYEQARAGVARHINAYDPLEVVFTSGATHALNLIARAWGQQNLSQGDRIILTQMEHHSNIVPWQQVAKAKGAKIKWVGLKGHEKGYELDIDALKQLLQQDKNIKLLSITGGSNVLGCTNDIKTITKLAHAAGAVVVVDAAQSVAWGGVDVQQWGCDFVAFSGHKVFGPFGIGVLWGRKDFLAKLAPVEFGGGMVKRVTQNRSTFLDLPYRFEAGTPPVAQAHALSCVLKWTKLLPSAGQYKNQLLKAGVEALECLPFVRLLGGNSAQPGPVFSFVLDQVHAGDVAEILNLCKIAVRAGHHCCEPLLHSLGERQGVLRVSFDVFNTFKDIERLHDGIKKAHAMLYGKQN